MAGNSVRFTASLDDNVSKKLGLIGQKFDKTFGKGSSASLFGNIGAKGIAVGFGLLSTAIGGVTTALGDAVKGAIEDEQSQARLKAALKASIKGWDGTTDAIEATITSQMRLGFSDDEQRASLALLVAATGDVTKAQDLSRAAMDLARLKGISLEEATLALIKTDDGHFRALQGLGIELDDNATSTDALAAIQKVADGQADAFANTTGGKLLDSQLKVNEAMEKVGAELLPVVSDLFQTLADDVIPALTPVLLILVETVKGLAAAWELATYWINKFIGKSEHFVKKGGMLPGQVGQGGSLNPGIAPKASAEGGWVGLRGPEMRLVGERGPEYVTPNHSLGMRGDGRSRDSHGHAIIIDGRQLAELIDERFAQKQRRMPARQST